MMVLCQYRLTGVTELMRVTGVTGATGAAGATGVTGVVRSTRGMYPPLDWDCLIRQDSENIFFWKVF